MHGTADVMTHGTAVDVKMHKWYIRLPCINLGLPGGGGGWGVPILFYGVLGDTGTVGPYAWLMLHLGLVCFKFYLRFYSQILMSPLEHIPPPPPRLLPCRKSDFNSLTGSLNVHDALPH